MIPLIITMDLEYAYDHDGAEQETIPVKLCDDLKSLKLPVTAFITSEFADKFTGQTKKIYESGNEIGCHGLNHGKNENYRKMGEENINFNLTNSSRNIEEKIQVKPVSFRGPGMATSSITQRILIENGYTADFSVCSQRFDFFNSMGGDIRWLSAPRFPYKPSVTNPYRRGNLPILVVPLSCIIFPFISGILYLFGINFMKRFFNLLMKESSKNGKPIVYLFHSYEFTQFTGKAGFKDDDNYIRMRRPILHRLYGKDTERCYNMNMELLKYMLSFDSVLPMTGKQYCNYLKDNTR